MNYALDTYVRRDILFVMANLFGKKQKNKKGTTEIAIPHPEIEEYIKESYEKE